jgi:F0F1-type ATP synthase epsilon subunit
MTTAESFTLEIFASTTSEIHTVEWVEIEGPHGSFLVGPNHSTLISIIKKRSTVTYKKTNAEQRSVEISGGIFRVSGNKAIILLDQ